ncbi:hypothetical protein [uncultured Gemella sp.]|uniref:hypothetical protein n=1 Tax=uncultured Gemella sp. TaxID=254352 RepID=UPI0028D38C4C|nr:hypothetical protein [uncultured Gemella sp.]
MNGCKGEKMMFDVFFDFLIGVLDDAKKSLKKLNKIHRIIAVIFYCVEVITLLIIAMLTIDDYQITRGILYLFGLFIFVSLCHILFYKKYLDRNKNLDKDTSLDNKSF